MKKNFLCLLVFFLSFIGFSQKAEEIIPPNYIKTIFFSKDKISEIPIFKLGESFYFSFDDLLANQSDYYYQITHHNQNWEPSKLSKSQFIKGLDDIRIPLYGNSINTLQSFSHYRISFPNHQTSFLVSGNYMLTVLNADKEIVFSRKFILYQPIISMQMQLRKARDLSKAPFVHNINLEFDFGKGSYVNPRENFNISLLQNGRWDNRIEGVKPEFISGNVFTYQQEKLLQFYAGNEYQFLDNSDILRTTNTIAKVTSGNGIYNTYLYSFVPNDSFYDYFQDVDGRFQPRNKHREDDNLESDYCWVYFSLDIENPKSKKVYVVGQFNNYTLTEENQLHYNSNTKKLEVALLLKQGFINYRFVYENSGKIDQVNALEGNFYQTQNKYQVLLYYRSITDRYDRVIGYGESESINITN